MSDGTDPRHRPKRELPFPRRLMSIEKTEDMRGSTRHSFPDVWELCDSYAAALYRLQAVERFLTLAEKNTIKVRNPAVLQAFDVMKLVVTGGSDEE